MVDDDSAALRREHDALAERLAARRSIDELRKAAYASFFGLIATGLTAKLAWDRWFNERLVPRKGPPLFFFVALVVAVGLAAFAVAAFVRGRRYMRAEDEAYGRMKSLRERLGLDP